MKYTLLIFLLCSCSKINRESRDHFFKGSPFRHGIVPVEVEITPDSVEAAIDNEASKRGKKIYQNYCLDCHGPRGKGDGVKAASLDQIPRNLAKLAAEVPNFKFYMMASQFKGKMPGWQNVFTEQEISDLEQYIKLLGHELNNES